MQKIFPIKRGGRFFHSAYENRQYVLLPSALMYARSLIHRLFHKQKPPQVRALKLLPSMGNQCLWIGHATFLIRLGNCTILTDPIFGHATWLFRRIMPVGMLLSEVPVIDYVLISHNHRDHMDELSIRTIAGASPHVTFLVPQGDKQWFIARGITRVHEYAWWESYESNGLCCTFLPARHWSGRAIGDRNCSLWGSWMLQKDGFTLFFAGDTAYWKHFSCIAHHFPRIDTALLPIGPCKPLSYMRASHLSATSAIQAFMDLRASQFIAMHWGTYYFGTDDIYTPLSYLRRAWTHRNIALTKQLRIPIPGQAIELLSLAQDSRFQQLSYEVK